MPRQRLPWFKIWVGATRHEKVVTLDDRSFRAWIELLDAASEQPVRGRFTSCAAAAAIIRRPPALLKRLIEARLIDEREDGIWLHDWADWQRWKPEDEPSNNTGITQESPGNNTGITQESGTNKKPPRVERAKKRDVDVEGEGEKDGDSFPPTASQLPPKGPAAAEVSEQDALLVSQIRRGLAPFDLDGSSAFWLKVLKDYGSVDLEAEAFKQADWMRQHKIRTLSKTRYLNWLERAVERAPVAAPSGDVSPYAHLKGVNCACGKVATHGNRCDACHRAWLESRPRTLEALKEALVG